MLKSDQAQINYKKGQEYKEACSNCQAATAGLWRKDEDGRTICNACGLYFRVHMVHRPVTIETKKVVEKKKSRVLEKEAAMSIILPPIYTSSHLCTNTLESQKRSRHRLQAEVYQLNQLLSETLSLLEQVNHALENPIRDPCFYCSTKRKEHQVARTLLSLAHSPPNH